MEFVRINYQYVISGLGPLFLLYGFLILVSKMIKND
nr:MAG TPA: hypothetical protein [Inoviridae sp.]